MGFLSVPVFLGNIRKEIAEVELQNPIRQRSYLNVTDCQLIVRHVKLL